MYKFIVFTILAALSLPICAAGPLDEAIRDIDRLSKMEAFSADKSALKRGMAEAAAHIERASLVQSIQVETLAKRISELEETVKKQQVIISHYEEVVAKLKAQTPGDSQ